ncbi:MAG: hypothetical protein ACFFDP_13565 [Promethearchaeota archaeon]
MAKASKVIPLGELSPSLAFGAAYFSVSSIGTRLTKITETYTEEGFNGQASFFTRIPDSEDRLEITIGVNSKDSKISLEIAGVAKTKLKAYLDEIAQKISNMLKRFSEASGTNLSHVSKAIVIERKLDEALNLLFTDPDFQKVYVIVADARERLIRLGGDFEPATLQMGAILEPLVGRTGTIPKDVHEELALNLLRWKKRIKQVVDTIIG